MRYIQVMNDEAGIRRANLNRLLKARKLGPTALSRAYKGAPTPPYWSDLRRGRKDFGEKAARDIEEGLGLPRGWLDHAGAPLPEAGVLSMPPRPVYSHYAGLAAEQLDKVADERLRERIYALWIHTLEEMTRRPEDEPPSGDDPGETGPAETARWVRGASALGAAMPN